MEHLHFGQNPLCVCPTFLGPRARAPSACALPACSEQQTPQQLSPFDSADFLPMSCWCIAPEWGEIAGPLAWPSRRRSARARRRARPSCACALPACGGSMPQ